MDYLLKQSFKDDSLRNLWYHIWWRANTKKINCVLELVTNVQSRVFHCFYSNISSTSAKNAFSRGTHAGNLQMLVQISDRLFLTKSWACKFKS